eukprot:COSAG02_NODE_1913_length_10405_cov_3.734330_5_plen_153_part_00
MSPPSHRGPMSQISDSLVFPPPLCTHLETPALLCLCSGLPLGTHIFFALNWKLRTTAFKNRPGRQTRATGLVGRREGGESFRRGLHSAGRHRFKTVSPRGRYRPPHAGASAPTIIAGKSRRSTSLKMQILSRVSEAPRTSLPPAVKFGCCKL